MRQLFIIIFTIICFSCSQWKVSTLKSKGVCKISSGDGPGKIALKYEDKGMLELSFKIKMHEGKIYTADNILKRVQVLDRDGSINLIIGPKRVDLSERKEFKYSHFNFSSIGSIAIDSDERIYIQNRFISNRKLAGRYKTEKLDFIPSYILVFDRNGVLQYTLGQAGSPNIPFYYIENMYVDAEDRLFVVSRTFDSWDLSRFYNRKRDFYVNLGGIDLNESEEGETYKGRIENISVFDSGDGFLISVAYYSKTRFKYRKIFEFSIKDNRIEKTVLNTPDPKNELFTVVDDKHIYLWDMKNRDIKFVICNFDGNIINNIMLKLDQRNSLFSDIIVDEAGQFYSYHVGKEAIDILEWK